MNQWTNTTDYPYVSHRRPDSATHMTDNQTHRDRTREESTSHIPCGYSTHCTTHRDRTREESTSHIPCGYSTHCTTHTETEQERSPHPTSPVATARIVQQIQSVTQRQNKRGVQIPCGYSTHCTTDTDNQSHRDRTREESKSPVATARIAQQIQTISHTETEQERSPNPLWLQHALHNRYRQSVTQRQNKRGVQIPCGYSTHCTTDTDNQSHRDRTREESKSPVATARIAQQIQTISHTETEQERSPNPLWLQHALHNRYRQSVTQRQKQERSPNPLWLQHALHNRYRQSVTQRQNKRGVQNPCGYSTHCTTDTGNASTTRCDSSVRQSAHTPPAAAAVPLWPLTPSCLLQLTSPSPPLSWPSHG